MSHYSLVLRLVSGIRFLGAKSPVLVDAVCRVVCSYLRFPGGISEPDGQTHHSPLLRTSAIGPRLLALLVFSPYQASLCEMAPCTPFPSNGFQSSWSTFSNQALSPSPPYLDRPHGAGSETPSTSTVRAYLWKRLRYMEHLILLVSAMTALIMFRLQSLHSHIQSTGGYRGIHPRRLHLSFGNL